MRYVPKLIPHEFKVLPDYFKGSPYKSPLKSKWLLMLYWLIGILFLMSALAFIKHPPLMLLLGLIGFIFLPPGQSWLEEKLQFTLTGKAKSIFAASLFICSIPLAGHYQKLDLKEAQELQIKKEADERRQLAEEKKEQQRKDSVSYYLQAATNLQMSAHPEKALATLSSALAFYPTENELAEINKVKSKVLLQRTMALVKKGDYKTALPELTSYLSSNPGNVELLYSRAICYNKTGKVKEAVYDLKAAIELGSLEAEKLHEKINPIRKRIVDHVTLCCDGTTSSATGRGACSWHGGVCNWNYPIYEEYRKY